jgi:hypothetical protein
VVIDPRQLTNDALAPDNPIGRHQARVCARALGFTRRAYESWLRPLETKALPAEASRRHPDQHGEHDRVEVDVTGPAGQQGIVRTGWLVALGRQAAVWVTRSGWRPRGRSPRGSM